jgi:DNA-directed RNA polymerase sigma subunit (sigma70/sigma32)
LGVTRERVRQIKEQALKRLRHASRARVLETFTD